MPAPCCLLPMLVSLYVAQVTFYKALFVFMFHGNRGMGWESETWVQIPGLLCVCPWESHLLSLRKSPHL